MLEILQQFTAETWHILTDAAPYVIFGFLAAGLVKAVLPEEFVAKHLGGRSSAAVLKASLLGIPLPLCSCGVIPAAISLRRQGAGLRSLFWCPLLSPGSIRSPSPGHCSIR